MPPAAQHFLRMLSALPVSAATLSLLLSLAVAALAVLAARCVRAYVTFRRAELAIPGPPSLPVLGNALHFLGVGHADVLNRLLALFVGRTEVFRFSLLGKLFLVVSDPEDIDAVTKRKDLQDKSHFFYDIFRELVPKGLLWLNGEEWRVHRRALQPAFHRAVLDRFQDTFVAEAADFVARVQLGRDVDVPEGVSRAVSRSFVRSLLREDSEEDLDRMTDAAVQMLHAFVRDLNTRSFQPLLWPDFVYSRTEAARRTRGLKELAEDTTRRGIGIMRRRRVLELEKKQQEGAAAASKERKTIGDILLTADEDGRLSDDDVCGEIMTFFAAAVETTVAALSILFKVLSLRHDVQQRIFDELDEVCQGSSEEITTAELERLQYTERVIMETMRLFPPTPLTSRENREQATRFAGYTVPRGTTIVLNVIGAHRDPRHWPEPLCFDPDRFLPERCAGRHPAAFLPFSAGQRDCVGRAYALRNIKTFLAVVLRAYRLEPAKGDEGRDVGALPVTFDITLKLVEGAVVRFEPRERPNARVA